MKITTKLHTKLLKCHAHDYLTLGGPFNDEGLCFNDNQKGLLDFEVRCHNVEHFIKAKIVARWLKSIFNDSDF